MATLDVRETFPFLVLTPLLDDFPGGSDSKVSAYNVGDLGSISGPEDLLEKEMATHSSILAWKIPWMEEPGRLQSIGSQESDTTEQLHFHFLDEICTRIGAIIHHRNESDILRYLSNMGRKTSSIINLQNINTSFLDLICEREYNDILMPVLF